MKQHVQEILIRDYTYTLPEDRIAAFPLAERDQSRLLVYKSGKIFDEQFYHLPHHLTEGSTLIVNNTRVIEARILFQKPTGAHIEIFCLEPTGDTAIEQALQQTSPVRWNCLIGGASKWKPGQILHKEVQAGDVPASLTARYIEKQHDSFVIEFSWQPETLPFAAVLHEAGAVPLPPYIKREVAKEDAERYQSVFAEYQGSVAAPTASLHFTPRTFEALRERNISVYPVTLHVGAGTFKPVKSETIGGHAMHAEHFHVPLRTITALLEAREIVAVGTTSLRTLESLYWIGVKILKNKIYPDGELTLEQWEAYELDAENISYKESLQAIAAYLKSQQAEELFCRTSLIIVPGYRFQSAKALITNFHQPQSTLLLLVAAFIGEDWRKVYEHALHNGYRFLSYGDSSLLWRSPSPTLPEGKGHPPHKT